MLKTSLLKKIVMCVLPETQEKITNQKQTKAPFKIDQDFLFLP